MWDGVAVLGGGERKPMGGSASLQGDGEGQRMAMRPTACRAAEVCASCAVPQSGVANAFVR